LVELGFTASRHSDQALQVDVFSNWHNQAPPVVSWFCNAGGTKGPPAVTTILSDDQQEVMGIVARDNIIELVAEAQL
jgi:hypothetical protein